MAVFTASGCLGLSPVGRHFEAGARRIVEVPPNDTFGLAPESRYDDIRNISEEELEEFTEYNLDHALDGDLGAANRGHVTARYLYALWPPETFGRADAFLQQQEWAEKALSYSLANLTAGETAGLLAFGQSYANNGTFTARDRYLGTAFIIAALDCGLELDYYAAYVDRFLNSEQFARTMADPCAEVLTMAAGLKGFCG